MSLQEEIKKAIGAHGLWKVRLLAAIEAGKSEFAPDTVCQDNKCDFGRWLYGTSLSPIDKHKPEYETCRHLHADFHQEAAHVLRMAITGQKDKAVHAMDRGGKFATISADLTSAMMKWMKASA